MDLFSEIYINIYKNPYNYGRLDNAMYKEGANNCGDNIKIYLIIKDNKIEKARFEGTGCLVSIVGASLLLKNIEGKTLDEVKKYSIKDLFDITGIDLSNNPTRIKCLTLALDIIKQF
jgi:nitrogen fixation NifU-like protein